eukprot:snap_masked-scaffold_40-processed-gene-1.36-mRNA-1 protein AED:1.00 eAED:1.00 QI:0/0/0/0/1/1/2/0/61
MNMVNSYWLRCGEGLRSNSTPIREPSIQGPYYRLNKLDLPHLSSFSLIDDLTQMMINTGDK